MFKCIPIYDKIINHWMEILCNYKIKTFCSLRYRNVHVISTNNRFYQLNSDTVETYFLPSSTSSHYISALQLVLNIISVLKGSILNKLGCLHCLWPRAVLQLLITLVPALLLWASTLQCPLFPPQPPPVWSHSTSPGEQALTPIPVTFERVYKHRLLR